MKVLYKPSFLKDLKSLQSTPEFPKIKKLVFEDIPGWHQLEDHPQVKRLKSHGDAYRLRVGHYRIGFYFSGGDLTFARLLHRREIYRYFP